MLLSRRNMLTIKARKRWSGERERERERESEREKLKQRTLYLTETVHWGNFPPPPYEQFQL